MVAIRQRGQQNFGENLQQ